MKKRILSLLLCVAMLLTLLPQTVLFASAATSGTCGDNLSWSYNSSTYTLTITGSGEMTDWNYSDVPWYSYRSSIKSVSLPDGLTSIGNYAFAYCTGLTSITIPDSVTSIGEDAFSGCSGLTSVTIGNSVTNIGEDAFYNCTGLTSITIPDSVTSIGDYAFSGCTGLTSITIPDRVRSIGDGAFSGCTGLTSITVAEGNPVYDSRNNCNAIIETATNTLIAGCKNTVIPSGVTSIGEYAFYNCTGLTSITIPDSVTSIGDCAFYGCTGLSHVHFLGSKPSIGTSAFRSCASDLTLCYLPETTGWENYTDYPAEEWDCTATPNCTSITYTCNTCGEAYTVIGEYHDWSLTETITAPTCTEAGSGVYTCTVCGEIETEAIEALGHDFDEDGVCTVCGLPGGTCGDDLQWCFDEATGTLTITGSGAMKNWSNSSSVPWYSYRSSIKSVSLPDGLTSIGDRAFWNCTGLTGITIPDSVTSIGNYAFVGCTGLTSITIGNSVTSIGREAFDYCTGLTSITIPDSVRSVGGYAFFGCTGLTSITIPSGVTSIGDEAFSGCTGLTSITVADGNPVYDSRNNCNAIIKTATNTLIAGCKNTVIPSGVTSIGEYAFYNCTGLTSITIPDSVTSIGDCAFYGCTGLSHVHFLGSKPSIGTSAFRSCASDLTLCYLPETTGWENYTDYPAEEWDCTATPNCTSITYTCNTCGEAYTVIGEYHDWSLTETITAPTCTEAGSGVYTCTVCGETETEAIEALGHDFDEDGVCTVCGYAKPSGDGFVKVTDASDLGDGLYLIVYETDSIAFNGGLAKVDAAHNNIEVEIVDGVIEANDATMAAAFEIKSMTGGYSIQAMGGSFISGSSSKNTIVEGTSAVANTITIDGDGNATIFAGGYLMFNKTSGDTNYRFRYYKAKTQQPIQLYKLNEVPACDHNWDEDVQTKEPSCTAAGSITYTCSLCGETRTEQTEPLGHSFVNGVCETCGEKLKIFSASLRLDENLNLVYAVQLPENIEDPHMVFTFLGTEITVTDYTVNADGRYCFELADINPQCMGDTISATLYATYDGTEYTDTIAEYSVRDYCVNMLAKTNDDLFVTLLSDLLSYGAAAQIYTNYKTDTLVTEGLSLSPSTFTALSGLTEEFVGTADPDTFWKSAGLTLSNNVDMNLFFCTDNVEGLSVVLEINGRTETVTDFTPVDGEEGLYQITFHGILATEFDLPVSASFYREGTQVGNTLNYSVNTYICSKQNDSDKALAAMVRALYNYGATANTYYFERYLVQ